MAIPKIYSSFILSLLLLCFILFCRRCSCAKKFRWWIVSFLYFLLLETIYTVLIRTRATFIIAVTTKLWKYEQILKVFLSAGTQIAYGIHSHLISLFKVNTTHSMSAHSTFLQHSMNALATLAQTWQIKTYSTISLHSNIFQCLFFICRIVGRQLPMKMTEWCRSFYVGQVIEFIFIVVPENEETNKILSSSLHFFVCARTCCCLAIA